MPIISPWTEERVKQLQAWTEEGFSASIIVDKFNEGGYPVTRNAVIGKKHRLGLYPLGRRIEKTRHPPVRKVKKAAANKLALLTKMANGHHHMKIVIPESRRGEPDMHKPDITKRVLLRKTKDGHCRAIIGYANGVLADAICCGEHAPWIINPKGKLVRSPWCEHHRSVYIQPDTGRRK